MCHVTHVHVTDLFAHDPLSSSGYPMVTHTHPLVKPLVARRLINVCMCIWIVACVIISNVVCELSTSLDSKLKMFDGVVLHSFHVFLVTLG